MADTNTAVPTWGVLYAERKPPTKGAYRWRVPSKTADGLTLEFTAHMRERGAGFVNAVSPAFDYWDGYSLHVPSQAAWRDLEEPSNSKWHEITDLVAVGVEFLPCPFCHCVPVLQAHHDKPQYFREFWLKCCAWVKSPIFADPRVLNERRNALLLGQASTAVIARARGQA